MVTRNEVKRDVLNHLYALDSEQSQYGFNFIDVDGLGLRVLAAMGVTKSFIGAPLRQFDRVYQFTIKYEQTDITSSMTDSALIRERDIDAFLEICKKSRMSVGIVDELYPIISGSIAPYTKKMVVRGRVDDFIDIQSQEQIISGQPILQTYKMLRSLQSKYPSRFKKMVDAVVTTNNFSISFRRLMKTLGKTNKA